MSSQDLVPGINPLELLSSRDKVLADMRHGLEILMLADMQAIKAGLGSPWDRLSEVIQRRTYHPRDGRLDETMKIIGDKMDQRGWETLLNASGLRTFMDREARDQWERAIRDKETPPLDEGSIEATFRSIHAERGLMVERGVVGVFRRLSWDHKTNTPALFGSKIIVRNFLDYHGFINSGAGGVDDLMRALAIYDDKPEPDHRSSIANKGGRGVGEWEHEYLRVKWFKNRNAHITFKRMDLVDKLNGVLAKHHPGALPAPR